ncbi:hypothetical protein A3Q56_01506 [Intoshia linei]|uniref:Structure-specific endonuclease subunit SLX4 n=1 Tax=Intoshia linei TaxID=1819745 RepID=A0A177B914_9BILA|nr:hypothetical protein A3Q56_01506 [Intoshia linei]
MKKEIYSAKDCPKCKIKTFFLQEHLKQCGKMKKKGKKVQESKEKMPNLPNCFICGKKFTTPNTRLNHLRMCGKKNMVSLPEMIKLSRNQNEISLNNQEKYKELNKQLKAIDSWKNVDNIPITPASTVSILPKVIKCYIDTPLDANVKCRHNARHFYKIMTKNCKSLSCSKFNEDDTLNDFTGFTEENVCENFKNYIDHFSQDVSIKPTQCNQTAYLLANMDCTLKSDNPQIKSKLKPPFKFCFSKMFNNQQFSDLKVKLDDDTFIYLHKFIFAAFGVDSHRNIYSKSVLDCTHFDAVHLTLFVNFLYTFEVSLSLLESDELSLLIDYFDLNDTIITVSFIKQCASFESQDTFTWDDAIKLPEHKEETNAFSIPRSNQFTLLQNKSADEYKTMYISDSDNSEIEILTQLPRVKDASNNSNLSNPLFTEDKLVNEKIHENLENDDITEISLNDCNTSVWDNFDHYGNATFDSIDLKNEEVDSMYCNNSSQPTNLQNISKYFENSEIDAITLNSSFSNLKRSNSFDRLDFHANCSSDSDILTNLPNEYELIKKPRKNLKKRKSKNQDMVNRMPLYNHKGLNDSVLIRKCKEFGIKKMSRNKMISYLDFISQQSNTNFTESLPQEEVLYRSFCESESDDEIINKDKIISDFIKFENPQIYESILKYEIIVFEDLLKEIKNKHKCITAKSLMNFLDTQCITFTNKAKINYPNNAKLKSRRKF